MRSTTTSVTPPSRVLRGTSQDQDETRSNFTRTFCTSRRCTSWRQHDTVFAIWGNTTVPERFSDLILIALIPDTTTPYANPISSGTASLGWRTQDIRCAIRTRASFRVLQAQYDLHVVKGYICRQCGHCTEDCSKFDPNYKKIKREVPSK